MRKRYLVGAAIVLVAAVLTVGAVRAGAFIERDKVPPVTSTDVLPQYWNTVAISAHATDPAGVAYVYYEFDGAVERVAPVEGSPADAVVALRVTQADPITPSPSPTVEVTPHAFDDPSASGAHTLTFWAQDVNGNVGARQTVAYKVGVDTEAPVTTVAGVRESGWYPSWVRLRFETKDAGASGVAALAYSLDGGAQVTVAGPAPSVLVPVTGSAEPRTVEYQSSDVAGNVEGPKTLTLHFDSQAPTTRAWNASVRKGANATLKFAVADVPPNGGTATVVLRIRRNNGGVVKTISKTVPVNVTSSAKFTCKLSRGLYFFTVAASDTAGNAQAAADMAEGRLTVK